MPIVSSLCLPQHTKQDIKQLFHDENIYKILISQIEQIHPKCISIISIYKKIFIKLKTFPKQSAIHVQQHQDSSLWLIRITKAFPLQQSVQLFLLEGSYQPRVFDTRDFIREVLNNNNNDGWMWKNKLMDVVQGIDKLEQKLIKRNQQYLTMQRTGEFKLGETFIYNQLEEHTSLAVFVDKDKEKDTNTNTNDHKLKQFNNINNSTLIGVSQTHLLTFKRVTKKSKTKQQQQYQQKSKTLYGKKYILVRYCQLQCIETLQINNMTKQLTLRIIKYKPSTATLFNQHQSIPRKFIFSDQNHIKFIRCILKSITKFQTMKIQFIPSFVVSDKVQKQDSVVQKVLELNEIESRLEGGRRLTKKRKCWGN